MIFIYPAVFRKKEDGRYHAFFPDLECCEASGDTLDEAVDNANEAARTWISVELEENDPVLPPITDPEDIKTQDGDIVRNIAVNIRFYEGWDEYPYVNQKKTAFLAVLQYMNIIPVCPSIYRKFPDFFR